MSILNAYLIKNLCEEQSSLLINCFNTLTHMGLVEIEFNIDELLGNVEDEELFTIVQACYSKVRQFQKLAFDQLEIRVNNHDDIGAANEVLQYLDQLEHSNQSAKIVEIIDASATSEDAFYALLEQVLFVDTTDIQTVVEEVPTRLMERLYDLHYTDFELTAISTAPLKEFDGRKLKAIGEMWKMRQINGLKHYIISNNINLPIRKAVWEGMKLKEMQHPQFMLNKKQVAVKLLEGCLVMNVKWSNLKPAVKQLAKEIYDDPLFIAQLSYEIDNVCMAYEINNI